MEYPAERPVVIDKKIGSLPFHDMPWVDFERLVWELVQARERLSPCHRYGTPGQAQGGIDIAGRSADGSWHAFQVKQVAKFTESEAKNAMDDFIHGPRPHDAKRLVIITSCKGTRTQVRDLSHRYQNQYPDLMLGEVWDAEQLCYLLRTQPLIVARYFGDDVAARFCDADHPLTKHSEDTNRAAGIPISTADPFSLEVHEAISVDTEMCDSLLPSYFRRPFDEELKAAVDEALSGKSVMKVLLGGSSTGKTRAAWESIQRLPEKWRLWHPASQEELLSSINSLHPRTVLWLNEINRYLLSGDTRRDEYTAARLTALIRNPEKSPVLVLGTAWHEHWATMTIAPQNERACTKSLLTRRLIRVPEEFDEQELLVLVEQPEQNDGRILQAAHLAEGGHIIQYLAGGPAQLERYEMGSPAARAVLQAAMDARRLGHGPDLPHAFLKAASAAYLTSLQRDLAQPDWFVQAIEYLSTPCRGVRGPLAPVPRFSMTDAQEPAFYRLSDFVEQHARRHRQTVCPEGEFWSAAAQYAATAKDRTALARAALDRGRVDEAESLALAAAEEGDGAALYALANWKETHSKDDDSLPYFELAAELGVAEAQVAIAWRYEREERLDEAEAWYRKAIEVDGISDAVVGLASVLTLRGDSTTAADLYEKSLEAGFFGQRSVEYQARWLAGGGQHELALILASRSFEAGNTEAFTGLAWVYRYKDTPRAIDVLQHAMSAGDANAPRELSWIYEEEGNSVLADFFCEVAVALGETNTLRGLGMIRRSKGRYRSAAGLFWRAYNLDLGFALLELAKLREMEGSPNRAEKLYRRALQEGHGSAMADLVRILETQGRTGEAESLAAHSVDLLRPLAQARAARGEQEAAEQLLTAAITQGHPHLLLDLAILRQRRNDLAGARLALCQAQDAGVHLATERMEKLLQHEADCQSGEEGSA
ncbi:hypothetical protein [Streptomyces sp. B22F1]|uniref:hypothetical protein n=1 Tax=Streptomyces sp. B22F1 TaxID=3153566 RepID=UPI00325D2831